MPHYSNDTFWQQIRDMWFHFDYFISESNFGKKKSITKRISLTKSDIIFYKTILKGKYE